MSEPKEASREARDFVTSILGYEDGNTMVMDHEDKRINAGGVPLSGILKPMKKNSVIKDAGPGDPDWLESCNHQDEGCPNSDEGCSCPMS